MDSSVRVYPCVSLVELNSLNRVRRIYKDTREKSRRTQRRDMDRQIGR